MLIVLRMFIVIPRDVASLSSPTEKLLNHQPPTRTCSIFCISPSSNPVVDPVWNVAFPFDTPKAQLPSPYWCFQYPLHQFVAIFLVIFLWSSKHSPPHIHSYQLLHLLFLSLFLVIRFLLVVTPPSSLSFRLRQSPSVCCTFVQSVSQHSKPLTWCSTSLKSQHLCTVTYRQPSCFQSEQCLVARSVRLIFYPPFYSPFIVKKVVGRNKPTLTSFIFLVLSFLSFYCFIYFFY